MVVVVEGDGESGRDGFITSLITCIPLEKLAWKAALWLIGSRLPGAPEGNQTRRVQAEQHLSDTTSVSLDKDLVVVP
ncbi:hypothetical protein EK904_011491 [Melospiza melodia maxima]|nr:hypothetical protein EK904_011491 [Melospiza melodia maxima]